MTDNQVGPGGNAPMEPLAPTGWTFELNLSVVESGMNKSTPPKLISTLQLPQDHQIQLQLKCGDDRQGIFTNCSYTSLDQYQLLLDKSVDYPVKISARIDNPPSVVSYGKLRSDLISGDRVEVQPGIPLPIVGLNYKWLMSQNTSAPANVRLLLTVHFTMPSTDAAEVFQTGNVAHMRSHGEQLGSLLSLGHFADCKVATNDNHFYDAHKNLLALKSEVFKMAFEADLVEGKTSQIRMDCDSDMADLILPFFYTGQMPKVTKESAAELYRLAHLYHIEGLRAYLAEEILLKANQLVEVQNVLEFAILGDRFDLKVFGQFCLKFTHENRREVMKLPQWEDFRSANPNLIDQLLLM